MEKIIKHTKPVISVIMSVYNGGHHLSRSIESILNQSYNNFEFIIINDGSTDNSLKVIRSYKDQRIRLVSRENKGLVYSLNEAVSVAKGSFIARQDADDISYPERFMIQVKELESNSEVDLIGGSIRIINEADKTLGIHYAITNINALKEEICFRGPFAHGTAFGRASVFKSNKYLQNMWPAEDYDLWERLSRKYVISNVEDIIYGYRENQKGISASNSSRQEQMKKIISERAIRHFNQKPKELSTLLKGVVSDNAKNRVISNRLGLIKKGVIPKKYLLQTLLMKAKYGTK